MKCLRQHADTISVKARTAKTKAFPRRRVALFPFISYLLET